MMKTPKGLVVGQLDTKEIFSSTEWIRYGYDANHLHTEFGILD